MTQKIQVSGKAADGTIVVVGGDTVAEFSANLGDLLGDAEAGRLLGVYAAVLAGDSSSQAALAAARPLTAPQTASTPEYGRAPQTEAQQRYVDNLGSIANQAPAAAPAAPAGIQLPKWMAQYNQLIPGLPTGNCPDCGAVSYPVTFSSRAGKTFKKYKCGNDKDHGGDWIN